LGKTPQEFDLENSGIDEKNSEQRKKPVAKLQAKLKFATLQTTVAKPASHVTTTSHAPSLAGGRKRAPDFDEFGLTAAQKRLQTQAMEKLQQRNSNAEHGGRITAAVAVSARKRSLDVDEFGLTAAQRQMQMQALAKLQLRSP
jgi:hypothetical protein